MINELADVKKYLAGDGLNRDIEYRICLLLSKWFYSQGITDRDSIRVKLKEWAIKNNYYFNVAMNPVIDKVIKNDLQLLGQEPVYINKDDIDIITSKFDTYEERLTALAVICYAKIYADKKGLFKLSISALANWLCIQPKAMRKYIDSLVDSGVIALNDVGGISSWYKTTVVNQLNTYKMNYTVSNIGDYKLVDNDIIKLYDDAILLLPWHNIPGYNDWYKINDNMDVRVSERYIGDKKHYSKVLKPTYSSSGKTYVYVYNENCKQEKIAVDKLYKCALQI